MAELGFSDFKSPDLRVADMCDPQAGQHVSYTKSGYFLEELHFWDRASERWRQGGGGGGGREMLPDGVGHACAGNWVGCLGFVVVMAIRPLRYKVGMACTARTCYQTT